MKHHSQLSDKEFETLFEKAELPPSLFNHEAHLRLAWLYINKYGEEKAAAKTCKEIEQFDRLHGKGNKFNTTMSVAAIKIVHHFIKKSESKDFRMFIEEFPRLKTAFKALVDQHYAIDIFSNTEAKASFIEPDLLAFD